MISNRSEDQTCCQEAVVIKSRGCNMRLQFLREMLLEERKMFRGNICTVYIGHVVLVLSRAVGRNFGVDVDCIHCVV